MTLLIDGLTFLLILAAACASAAESKQKLNVVVILADDLGWADLSCYGSTFHETPTGVTLNAPSPNVRLNLKPSK